MIKLKPGMRIKCNSEDEAKEFIKLAYKQGFKWNDSSKDDVTAWSNLIKHIIYNLHKDMTITFSINTIFREDLINYSDLKKGEYATMTKADLENGMVVETRMGEIYFVHNKRLLNKKGRGHMKLYTERGYYDKEYNEDLTRPDDINWDIIRVYKSDVYNLEDMFDKNNLELIWERKEDKHELSKKDKKVIKKGLKKVQELCKKHPFCNGCELYKDKKCPCMFLDEFDMDKLFED